MVPHSRPERTKVSDKLQVLLTGQNLSIELEDKVQKVGFYTTRFVESELESSAVDLIRADARLLTMMRNAVDDPPVFGSRRSLNW